MDQLPVLTLVGIPIIIIVFAIVEEIKAYGVTGAKTLRACSLFVGVGLATLAQLVIGLPTDLAGWVTLVVVGVLYGLVASGGYDFLDPRMPRRV